MQFQVPNYYRRVYQNMYMYMEFYVKLPQIMTTKNNFFFVACANQDFPICSK